MSDLILVLDTDTRIVSIRGKGFYQSLLAREVCEHLDSEYLAGWRDYQQTGRIPAMPWGRAGHLCFAPAMFPRRYALDEDL